MADETPWRIDSPNDRATPPTIHRADCAVPAAGENIPADLLTHADEEQIRHLVAENPHVLLCRTCLPPEGPP